jgi:amino acid permease
MENAPYQKLLTPLHIILGLALSFLVFIMMSYLLVPFTFSPDPFIAQLQACLTAVPITAVFWFAYHMFMVVLMDQKKQKAAKQEAK